MSRISNNQLQSVLFLFVIISTSTSYGALRIVTYNMLSGEGHYVPSSLDDKVQVLIDTGNYAYNGIERPFDVLVAQELSEDHIIEDYIVNGYGSVDGLNDYYGPGVYAYGTDPVEGDGYNCNGMIYNTQTVQLLETISFRALDAPRETLRYKFRIVGYGPEADFYIYNSHMKAFDDETSKRRRTAEAQFVRWSNLYGGDSLPEGTNIIYAGDFNLIGGGTEDCSMPNGDVSGLGGYDNPWYYFVKQELFAGNPGYTFISTGYGQANDPSGGTEPVNWNEDCDYKHLHTWDSYYPDTRFDFQLVTDELYDGEGVSFIGPGIGDSVAVENSLRPLGNDGTHPCNGRIADSNSGRYDSSVFYDLDNASDHLPVIADYQVPAKMNVSVSMPNDIWINDVNIFATVTIENTADVTAVAGADELDYEINVISGGVLIGPAIGIDQPLNGGNEHLIKLNTYTDGQNTFELEVTSPSQAAADGYYYGTFGYFVENINLAGFVQTWLLSDEDQGFYEEYDFFEDGFIDFIDFAILVLH